MPFIRPSVRVFQQLISASPRTITPFFELCIVGPAYQVVKDAAVGSYVAGTALACLYTGQRAGTDVDVDSLNVVLNDVFLKTCPETAATMSLACEVAITANVSKVTLTGGSDTYAGAEVGDLVDINITPAAGSPVVYTSTVHAISTDKKEITLKKNIPTPAPTDTVKVTVYRPYATPVPLRNAVDVTGITASGFTLAASLTTSYVVNEQSKTLRIYKGSPKASYRALRTYLANDFVQINNQNEIEASIGAPDPLNPLALAASIVYANASVSFKVLPIESDTHEGYLNAIDVLTTSEKVYVIVPLTQNTQTISAFANHCKAMSEPEKSRWRVMYCNMELPMTKVVVEMNAGVLKDSVLNTSILVKDEANGMFVSTGVKEGDFIDVYTLQNVYVQSFMVDSVLNDTVAVVSAKKYLKTDEGYVDQNVKVTYAADTNLQYEVTRVLTRQGIADTMVSVAKSFMNKRVRLVQPDQVLITVNDADYLLPGYYLCVAYGAMRAGFPPHQGFTTLGIGGIKRIYRSNKFFNDGQLDEMAGGGVFWVVQDAPESLPYCIYQTTTDTTQLETIEDSIVATIDYASKYYKDNLKAVIGKFNVNEISVKYVTNVINDITEQMKAMKYPYIGSVIINGSIKSITTDRDKIKPVVGIEVPFPVNGVDLYLEV